MTNLSDEREAFRKWFHRNNGFAPTMRTDGSRFNSSDAESQFQAWLARAEAEGKTLFPYRHVCLSPSPKE